jgi:trans-aconitate 2-methyltransferase
MSTTDNRDWDAATYHQVSAPQQSWAGAVLDRLNLRDGETVLDAGCGSGAVTARIVELVPEGRVYAVDAAPSMVEHTRQALGASVHPPVVVLCQDLADLALPEPVDAIFSNATFHWIPDHAKLFSALFAALKPGGRLVAQCGGKGNIDRFRVTADEVALGDGRFAPYFAGWEGPWNYADAPETGERLQAAGFADVQTWLEPQPTLLEDPRPFIQTVCVVRHLDRLPAALHDAYLDAVLERTGIPLTLDYVRLNMVARRPA